ncbi:hypothetical protein K470DRAFT_63493 [Piedraia hortae CBS 480.64]|uniref:Uncharacterized protein n=1 Tax=Piedraia hortae CBS 480.64 TaxID=1314780 RepID=A0A6A7BZZ7_9PEZI|nr:hypothetical protein K470DRAFT_63493 [Piedraia hortae CBS 480.64]
MTAVEPCSKSHPVLRKTVTSTQKTNSPWPPRTHQQHKCERLPKGYSSFETGHHLTKVRRSIYGHTSGKSCALYQTKTEILNLSKVYKHPATWKRVIGTPEVTSLTRPKNRHTLRNLLKMRRTQMRMQTTSPDEHEVRKHTLCLKIPSDIVTLGRRRRGRIRN